MSDKLAYIILDTVRNEEGYIPCIVKEGEKGYYKTDWNWGHDKKIAQECATERNEKLGLTQEDVDKLVLASM